MDFILSLRYLFPVWVREKRSTLFIACRQTMEQRMSFPWKIKLVNDLKQSWPRCTSTGIFTFFGFDLIAFSLNIVWKLVSQERKQLKILQKIRYNPLELCIELSSDGIGPPSSQGYWSTPRSQPSKRIGSIYLAIDTNMEGVVDSCSLGGDDHLIAPHAAACSNARVSI